MRQYLAGDRAMPRSASGLLCVSCILLGAPAGLLAPWLPVDVVELMDINARTAGKEIV